MKPILLVAIAVTLATACSNADKPAATTASVDTTLPYKATYSSSFVIPADTKNVKATLQSYKDWEDDKLANAPAYFADTVTLVWDDGSVRVMGRDSMVHFFQKYRDSLSSTKIQMLAWTNLHSTDKNEDWVNCWYKQTNTWKTGKVDSVFYQDDNRLKDGKISYISSKKQLLKK